MHTYIHIYNVRDFAHRDAFRENVENTDMVRQTWGDTLLIWTYLIRPTLTRCNKSSIVFGGKA